MSVVSNHQLAAFRATHYRVFFPSDPFTLRIGQHSAALERLHKAHGFSSSAYLTAWNPLGNEAPARLNAEWQSALQRDLVELGLITIPGKGIDTASGWAEESVLVIGLLRDQAIELGNKYRQLAIVYSEQDAVPELIVLQ